MALYNKSMDWSRCSAVDRNPNKLGGAWCFAGTRLAVSSLFEYFDLGSSVDEFFEAFPDVDPTLVHEVLAFAKCSLEEPASVA